MKVILFNPMAKNNREAATSPLGLLSIASHLQNCGHLVKLLDRTATAVDYKKEIGAFEPDIIGISFLSTKATQDVVKISDYAHSKGIPVIFGNTLSSATSDLLLNDGYADYVGIGEGEFTFEELLKALENKTPISEVKGLAYKEEGKIIYTEPRPFADGAQLPVVDWTLVDPLRYAQPIYGCKKMTFVYASKGCTANCSFCFNKTFHNQNRRKRPYDNVVKEIRDLVENYGFDGIFFGDELWSANRSELYENCRALKAMALPFAWGCHLRIGMFNQEDYHFMYDCGCRWIFYGVESGSEKILKKINKGIKPDSVVETIKMTCEAGIMTLPYFIIGFPEEDEEDLRQTVKLIKAIKPYSNAKAFFLSPLIGTKLHTELIEKNVVKKVENTLRLDTQWNELQKNYSEVSDRDLKVIRSHIVWWSITNNVKNVKSAEQQSRSYLHPLKVLISVLSSVRQNGIKRVVPNMLYSAWEVQKILFNITFFPKIKKKYDLLR